MNVGVAAARIVYGLSVSSLAIYGDGLHAMTDGLNNVVGLAVLAVAKRPADNDHPYGHQRYEVLASAAVGLVLIGLATELLSRALDALEAPLVAPAVGMGGWVLLFATLVTNVGVATWERHMGRRLRSPLLVADAAHTAADVVLTIGVITSTALAALSWPALDVLASVVLAAVVGVAGMRLLWDSGQILVDRRAMAPEKVAAVVRDCPGVLAVERIRSRGAPGAVHVDLVVRLAPDLTLERAHALTEDVEALVLAQLDDVIDVVVHAEPAAAPEGTA